MVKWLKSTNKTRRATPSEINVGKSPFIIFRSRQLLVTSENAVVALHFLAVLAGKTETRNHTKICCVSYKALKT